MAQSVNINQRIVILGGDDARKQLEAVAKAGQDMGENIKKSIGNVNQPLQTFEQGVSGVEVSAKAARYAVQNLTFQINDVVTSLASGISPFRTFTQQGGQFVQLFQQGGGIGNVLGTFAKGVAAWLTPTRLAIGGIAALTAGIGFLTERIIKDQDRIRTFSTTLQGLGKQAPSEGGLPTVFRGGQGTVSQPPGQRLLIPEQFSANAAIDLNKATQRLQQQLLISRAEATKSINEILQANINPAYAEQIVRIGGNIGTLGHNTQELVSAVKSGVPELQQFARAINIDPRGLNSIPALLNAIDQRTQGLLQKSLDPVTRKFKEIEVAASQTADSFAAKFQAAFVKVFDAAQKFPINFPQGIKNLRDTASALDDVFDGLQKKIANSSGFKNFVISADALDGLINSFADAVVRGMTKGLHNLIITADALDGLLNAVADVVGRGISRGLHQLDISIVTPFEDALVGVWGKFQNAAITAIGYVQGLLNDLLNLFNKFSFGGSATGSKTVASAAIPPAGTDTSQYYKVDPTGGFAGGGIFRGMGSGTSDSNWIRISDGEYIVNASATRANRPLLDAINSIGRPMRSGRGFAAGGLAQLVANQTGFATPISEVDRHTKFTLVIEGQQYADLIAPENTANSLLQHARTSSILSLGPSPSWKR